MCLCWASTWLQMPGVMFGIRLMLHTAADARGEASGGRQQRWRGKGRVGTRSVQTAVKKSAVQLTTSEEEWTGEGEELAKWQQAGREVVGPREGGGRDERERKGPYVVVVTQQAHKGVTRSVRGMVAAQRVLWSGVVRRREMTEPRRAAHRPRLL